GNQVRGGLGVQAHRMRHPGYSFLSALRQVLPDAPALASDFILSKKGHRSTPARDAMRIGEEERAAPSVIIRGVRVIHVFSSMPSAVLREESNRPGDR